MYHLLQLLVREEQKQKILIHKDELSNALLTLSFVYYKSIFVDDTRLLLFFSNTNVAVYLYLLSEFVK